MSIADTADRIGAATPSAQLCLHGHFYQPPREDPTTGEVPSEPGAAPYHDFNEKIAAECYRPNAELGNFEQISFDLGPTLATWLERHDPATLARIVAADRANVRRHGRGNAMAQVYNHAIMPLATEREKRVQVAWGVADFRHRFGRAPEGMWLAETAADGATLDVLADFGLEFTVLAPWQARDPRVDVSEPHWVPLPSGRRLAAFFYHAPLSGGVSFDRGLTVDAVAFGHHDLPRHVHPAKRAEGTPQILTIATDGELYGHHHDGREHFLARLLRDSADAPSSAAAAGFGVTWPARYLAACPPRRETPIHDGSSWSCHHGVARWSEGCGCTEGDGAWKWQLRAALRRLASGLDEDFLAAAAPLLRDPFAAVEEYLPVRLGAEPLDELLARHARVAVGDLGNRRLGVLLEAQYRRHLMFTSCAFFFEDLDRLEPRQVIAHAAQAASLSASVTGRDRGGALHDDLRSARSWRTGRTGADLLDSLRECPVEETLPRAA